MGDLLGQDVTLSGRRAPNLENPAISQKTRIDTGFLEAEICPAARAFARAF
jgi:hypothetical protein